MKLIVVGVNHKSAPIEVREKLCLNVAEQELLLAKLKSVPCVFEACVLETCHRMEIYAHVTEDGIDGQPVVQALFDIKKTTNNDAWRDYSYMYTEQTAVQHLLSVAAGLDSVILGENQILGQVKAAFELSRKAGILSRSFNILANIAVRTGKKARTETKINHGGSSISWAAVAKAEQVLGDLQKRQALVIGAGKMSELAVGHIQNKKFKNLYLMNRTAANAHHLAKKYGGEVVSFCDMREVLQHVDVCICSASAPHYLVESAIIKDVMSLRNFKPMVIIDISMPRNVDPSVSEIRSVQLYQIDDLNEAVDSNMDVRKNAIDAVKTIIDDKTEEYYRKLRSSPSNPSLT